MTVLPRGARGRRGRRRPGWVFLSALLILAIGASSALVFTNQVELLKLAVILALWAAVAGAFVSVAYRRQSDVDQARVRDLKLVYDLQLDREISARREYELTVESQLRRELVSELRAQGVDDVAALRAELSALRTSLQILFDTDLAQRAALETPEAPETGVQPGRAYSEWDRSGGGRGAAPVDWVSSDRVTATPADRPPGHASPAVRADDTAIIDVPEEPLAPPRQPQPQGQGWQPPPVNGPWFPPVYQQTGRRRARHASTDEPANGALVEANPEPKQELTQEPKPEPKPEPTAHADSGRRSRPRHSVEYRDDGVLNFTAGGPTPAPVDEPPAQPPAPPRHRGADHASDSSAGGPETDGQSVAELLARMQVPPSKGGKRRRRDS
ncbi:MAG: DUF6779 domain-containing protein [Mycobacterium sp.]